MDKVTQVVVFSSTAIALYGYDQGMMSLINTNEDYLSTMGLPEESPIVGLIVALYYLGTAVGAVIFSFLADRFGRKPALFGCLAMSSLGNLVMFVAGLKFSQGAIIVMIVGRIVMGLGVGGVDAVVPVYSYPKTKPALGLTVALGKSNQWAWRLPIIIMQIYPVLLMAFIGILPESPRWLVSHDRKDDAKAALTRIYGEDQAKETLDNLIESNDNESSKNVTYTDMLTPGHAQFHPTMVTVMGQINQALTGYGAVSVYGPQIFELLGFDTRMSEYLTQGNYVSYFILMTFAWLLVDAVGRRNVLLGGSIVLTVCFFLLTLFGGLAFNSEELGIPDVAVAVPGIVALYVATGAFGIGWLATIWIFPTTARAQGTAVSVVVWGVANFAVTLLTPILFNNLNYWLFLVFGFSNMFAGVWTYFYQPESGGRSFEENQKFFEEAKKAGTWRVGAVLDGEFKKMPYPSSDNDDSENTPLLRRVRDQVSA
ncbi:unnamed protein product [Aureobasidium mustum]|uniref:Major facilitator superfamily (MFS) profile domain-containing protein n=1 Tax=Aureobasidium mustum TaxID=2773714 RepID=A0A9N8K0W8_9PEZI|nr:unnamed protein product [Aureobasidium mustum]